MQPPPHREGARRQQRRIGGRGGGGLRPSRAGLGHRRVDPPAGSALRRGRHEADVRTGLALRAGGLRQLARPDRSVRQHGRGRLAPLRRPLRARPLRQYVASLGPRADSGDGARGGRGHPDRPLPGPRRRLRAGRGGAGPRGGAGLVCGRGEGGGDLGARVRLRAVRLLPHRAGRGVVQPRPLRRGPLRTPGRRPGRGGDEHSDPNGGLRRRGQASGDARHLRTVRRLLRRVLRPGPARPHAGHAGVRPGLRIGGRAAGRDGADDGVRPWSEGGRPDGHVHERRLHHSVQLVGSPGHLRAVRDRRRRSAGRRAGTGAGAGRGDHVPRGTSGGGARARGSES